MQSIAYFSNMAGCVAMAYFGTYLAGIADEVCTFRWCGLRFAIYAQDPWNFYVMHVGYAKVHELSWGQVFLRGIGSIC